MPRTHYLPDDERVHDTWDAGHEPVLGIDSGDTAAACSLRPMMQILGTAMRDARITGSSTVESYRSPR